MKFYSLPVFCNEHELFPYDGNLKKLKAELIESIETGSLDLPYFTNTFTVVFWSTKKRTYTDEGRFEVYKDCTNSSRYIRSLFEKDIRKDGERVCNIKKEYVWLK